MTTQEKIEFIATHYGIENQFTIAIEEMAELTKEICKSNRENSNPLELNLHLLGELADVEIMVKQLRFLLPNNDLLDEIIKRKLDRQLERIASEEENV